MNKLNFTKEALAALPIPKEKRAVYHDAGGKKSVSGLGLLIQPTGHRSFFWIKKVNHETVRLTIGKFPDFSIEQARQGASQFNSEAGDWKLKKFAGKNPFKHPGSLTLDTLYAKYLETLKTKGCTAGRGPATAKSLKDTNDWYERFLKSWGGERELDAISGDRARELHQKITEKHGPIIANRALGLLRRCINWGIRKELWKGENPAEKIDWNHEQSRERFVQPEEMTALMKALQEERLTNPDLHDFVLLSLYCGQRKSNTLAIRWEQIMASAAGSFSWQIPVTKNGKPHIVPLVEQALHVLQERKKRLQAKLEDGQKLSAWVFPSDSKLGHIKDMKKSWDRLRKKAKISDVHIHDLRRTLGSYMAGANVSLPIVGKALGHRSLAATQVYAKLQLDPVRDAMALAVAGMQKQLEAKRG